MKTTGEEGEGPFGKKYRLQDFSREGGGDFCRRG